MAKHGNNQKLKLIDGAEVHASGLCSPGDVNGCDHRAPDRRHVRICKAWLQKYAIKCKTMNTRDYSYSLKHQVEYSRLDSGGDYYVSNGSLILAALELGYSYKRVGDSPNAVFNLKFLQED